MPANCISAHTPTTQRYRRLYGASGGVSKVMTKATSVSTRETGKAG